MMNNEPIQQESTNDDIEQKNEFDDLLKEAFEVDGGEVNENGVIEAPVDESEQVSTEEVLFPIVCMAFDVMVPHWKVKEKEKKALSEAYGALLDKYFPNSTEYLGVEITALMVTGMICMPRIIEGRQEKEVNPQKEPVKKKAKEKADFSGATAFDIGEITLD